MKFESSQFFPRKTKKMNKSKNNNFIFSIPANVYYICLDHNWPVE